MPLQPARAVGLVSVFIEVSPVADLFYVSLTSL